MKWSARGRASRIEEPPHRFPLPRLRGRGYRQRGGHRAVLVRQRCHLVRSFEGQEMAQENLDAKTILHKSRRDMDLYRFQPLHRVGAKSAGIDVVLPKA